MTQAESERELYILGQEPKNRIIFEKLLEKRDGSKTDIYQFYHSRLCISGDFGSKVSFNEFRMLFRQLDGLEIGRLVAYKFSWFFYSHSVSNTALGKQKVLNRRGVQKKSDDKFFLHQFPLRNDYLLELLLPKNFTEIEYKRICDYLLSIVIPK